jgi:tRNA threonylcarbamoyl adenosine modification protein YeaZ
VDPRRHTELLMPQVAQALGDLGVDRREITEIAVGVGPGPFTGLRVGLVAARMLGAALNVPVRGVCSLDVIAFAVSTTTKLGESFLVATDARRREVYWAAYNATGTRTDGPHVDAPKNVLANRTANIPETFSRTFSEHIVGTKDAALLPAAGRGAWLYPDVFARRIEPQYPSAGDLAMAVVTRAVEILPPDPLYLRRPDATPPGRAKSVLTQGG